MQMYRDRTSSKPYQTAYLLSHLLKHRNITVKCDLQLVIVIKQVNITIPELLKAQTTRLKPLN